MGKLDGKVAFITGAARGQGRSHALKLAGEGADIIALDICAPVVTNVAPPSTEDDLAETVRLVEQLDRRIVASVGDVRKSADVEKALQAGIAEFGRVDIVCANAGVWTYGLAHELTEDAWNEVVDIVLTGVWITCKAAIPQMIEQGDGGSIIITSSAAGLKGMQNIAHYAAAKHGVVGLMRSLANELGPHQIRVNTVHPGTVSTELIHNPTTYALFAPGVENPTRDDVTPAFASVSGMNVPWIEREDVSNMVLFLATDDSRYVTGSTMVVDAGVLAK